MTHDAGAGPHLVHFYEDEEQLAASVSRFLAAGLYGGDALVVIARPARAAALSAALREEGVDVDEQLADGRLAVLDAGGLLDSFMAEGRPDPRRFDEVIGALLRKAGEGHPGVHVFGEMVSILWERGDVAAALVLEDLWNGLLASHSFVLYCAYPSLVAEAPEHAAALDTACSLHSGVLHSGVLRSGVLRSGVQCDGAPGAEGAEGAYAHFEATTSGPAAARRFVSRTLSPAAGPDLIETAVLVASELTSNALVHCRSPFTVAVSCLARTVRISVRDDCPTVPVARVLSDHTGGRGLPIVAALSREWGSVPLAGGKVVWAELEREPAGAMVHADRMS